MTLNASKSKFQIVFKGILRYERLLKHILLGWKFKKPLGLTKKLDLS